MNLVVEQWNESNFPKQTVKGERHMWNRTKQHRRKKLFFPTLFDQRLRSNDEHTKMLLMRSAAIVCRFKSSAYIFVTSHYSVFTSLINLFQWQNRYYLSIKFGYWYIWYIIKTKHIFSISSQIWSSVQWTTLMFLAHALSMYTAIVSVV